MIHADLRQLGFTTREISCRARKGSIFAIEVTGREDLKKPESSEDLIVGRKVEIDMASWSGYQPTISRIDGPYVWVTLRNREYRIKIEKILYMLPEEV